MAVAEQAGDPPPRKLAPSEPFRGGDRAEGPGGERGWDLAGAWGQPPTRRRLVAFARRYVGDPGDAEDIAQETLLRAGSALPRVRALERGEAWLFRICRHAAIDHVRSRRVRRHVWASLPEDVDGWAAAPEPASPTTDDDGATRELPRTPAPTPAGRRGRGEASRPAAADLRGIPAHHRLLLGLHYAGGLSQPALCRLTGLSASALRVRLFRARRSLAGLGGQGRRAG